MKITATTVLFSLFSTSSAFLNQHVNSVAFTPAITTSRFMSDAPAAAEESPMLVDENFDDIDIVRLLGLKRVKNMIKRNKRGRDATSPDTGADTAAAAEDEN